MRAWFVTLAFAAAAAVISPRVQAETLPGRLFDLQRRQELGLPELVPELARHKLILVGEHHSERSHHLGQLAVIQALQQAGIPLAIGMEMLRRESQQELDRWVDGTLDRDAMRRLWAASWGVEWGLYAQILEFARRWNVPLVGLNIARNITRQVARSGFASLSAEQRASLYDISCQVDADYMHFIREAFDGHPHGQMNFEYFCEAQLVWDSVMAIHARDWLTAHPGRSMVLLAGTGHAHKLGIPVRFAQIAPQWPVKVILPQVPGRIDARQLDADDADYILLMP
jgi:uncharacterized iron-regulated protein